ncbi:MAG: sn-glycerol-3-phosphate ABC transporter ATP-binding protein UgpC [Desulfobacteraceae bacterium]|nr:MAG: sn-glycerol-3-phosphate ABC transporter ATP-binding protein UgpC [Desulfobacteraceae bacterium]
MAQLELRNLSKKFGDAYVLKDVNLTVEDRSFVVLVGPSGCGKSTALMLIAGLEEVTSGEILIDGRVVNHLEPRERDIAMVFQSYALYPHMNVFKNMAFGLKLRGLPEASIRERVVEAARILEIESLLERKPKELSGGQRQRVAMGRAIVRKPKVFLFDEPLSNLDAKLRLTMRAEISRLHERLRTTIIYVTHDQVEAMTLAERIVIMKEGRIMDDGKPLEIYRNPANMFVAGFIGSPAMNFFRGVVERDHDRFFFRNEEMSLLLPDELRKQHEKAAGRRVVLGIRPHDMTDAELSSDSPGWSGMKGRVELVEPTGNEVVLLLSLGSTQFRAVVDPGTKAKVHQEIEIRFDPAKIHLFDDETEKAIR